MSQRIQRKLHALLWASLLLGPASALAGTTPPVVVVAGAGAPGIPTMSTNLMIALGVLLAVVALRFLQQRGNAQKFLSLLLLGGGLTLGGLGIDQTRATDAGFSDGSTACGGGQESQNIRDPFGGGTLFNSCSETNLVVVAYLNYPCSSAEQIKVDADVGDIITAGGSGTLNRCPAPMML